MKYTILAITLFLVGCSDSASKIIDGLERLQKETQYNLQTCQSQLEIYRGSINENTDPNDNSTSPEYKRPSEPEYETVNAYHIQTKMGNTVCYERNSGDEGEDIACGMTFSECKDGYIYRCMVDVKYKIIEEQKRIEE